MKKKYEPNPLDRFTFSHPITMMTKNANGDITSFETNTAPKLKLQTPHYERDIDVKEISMETQDTRLLHELLSKYREEQTKIPSKV